MRIFLAMVAALLVFSYLADVPIVSTVSAIALHAFGMGFVARAWVERKENVLIESLLLSVAVTAAIGLLLGNVLPVAGAAGKAIMLVVVLGGAWIKRNELRTAWKQLRQEWKAEGKTVALVAGAAAIPFFLIFFANPMYSLISDGWWHCSIYNTMGGTLPPENPWYPQASLGYPYAYHVFLAYAADGLNCLDGLNLFDYLATAIAMLGIYLIAKETFGKKETALFAALAFLFVSHLGGLVFLYDLVRLLPAGLDGYLAFLKSVHGPHVYYGHLAFMGSGIVIPFQMATMMAAFHFAMLAALLYFLHKEQEMVVGIVLGVLVATNPLVGLLGVLTTAGWWMLKRPWKRIKEWIIAALIGIAVAANYLMALLGKTSVVGGELIGSSSHLLVGFLVGYAPLLVLAALFFRQHTNVPTRMLWIAFGVAVVIGALAIGKAPAYFYTDATVLLAIAAAPWLASVWIKRNYAAMALVAVLIIPTFLVVGSYAYYRIPLDEAQLDASNWLKENTANDAVVLAEMELNAESNIHQYVPVFGERKVFLGSPWLLRIYGEDTAGGLEVYTKVFEQRNEETICELKRLGVDYIYAKSTLAGPCLEPVYENEHVWIYEVK